MTDNAKPIPRVTEGTRRYWEACVARTLLLPKCCTCGDVFFFPDNFCPDCLSEEIEWVEASGKGKVHTFSIVYRPPSPPFSEETPYVVAMVDLEEGPRMMSNLVEIEPDKARVGMPVEVVFEDASKGIALPKFRPVE